MTRQDAIDLIRSYCEVAEDWMISALQVAYSRGISDGYENGYDDATFSEQINRSLSDG